MQLGDKKFLFKSERIIRRDIARAKIWRVLSYMHKAVSGSKEGTPRGLPQFRSPPFISVAKHRRKFGGIAAAAGLMCNLLL